MFKESPSNLLDPTRHTQGGHKHLLQHLWDSYKEHLAEKIDELTAAGKPTITVEQAAAKTTADRFLTWASTHLKENRPLETFYVDENIGLRLTDNTLVAVSPGTEFIQGTMQDANAVSVTHGKTRKGQEGVVGSGGEVFVR